MILIKNAIIVTQDKNRRVIKDGAIFIEGEEIKEVGESAVLFKKYGRRAKKIINGKNKVVMPGLINGHTHAAMALFRGYGDDMPLKEWLTKKIWPAEAKMTTGDNYRGAKIACKEMLSGGVTAFNDMYWYQKGEIKAAKEIGLRHFAGILVINTGFINLGPKEIKKIYENLRREETAKIKIALAPHSIYAVSKKTLIWCKKFADENNLLLHIHLSETEDEIHNCLKTNKCRPAEYLDKIGFLGENVITAHACWLSDGEIKILAERMVSVAHCPTSNLKLVSGIMPFSKLISAGVNVCLGTDGAASNNSLDMFWEMKMAALIHKWNEKNPQAAAAQAVLDMATVNGAKALGVADKLGSLEPGKKADLIILDFNKPHLMPLHNVISHLVYSAKGSDVQTTIINGKEV